MRWREEMVRRRRRVPRWLMNAWLTVAMLLGYLLLDRLLYLIEQL